MAHIEIEKLRGSDDTFRGAELTEDSDTFVVTYESGYKVYTKRNVISVQVYYEGDNEL